LKSWPVDCLPNQRQITAQFIHKTYDELLATSSPTDRARMEAVGKYELPVVEPRRPNSLFFSDSTQKSSIYHAPMAYMALTTCQLLSDDCLSITASLQCGMPLSGPIVSRVQAVLPSSDSYGDDALNSHFQSLQDSFAQCFRA